MVFTDDLIDLLIGGLIEERFSSNTQEEGVISYTDYRATLQRMYPRWVKYFDAFFVEGNSYQEIAEEFKVTDQHVEELVNKIRGVTVMYLYKKMLGAKK